MLTRLLSMLQFHKLCDDKIIISRFWCHTSAIYALLSLKPAGRQQQTTHCNMSEHLKVVSELRGSQLGISERGTYSFYQFINTTFCYSAPHIIAFSETYFRPTGETSKKTKYSSVYLLSWKQVIRMG